MLISHLVALIGTTPAGPLATYMIDDGEPDLMPLSLRWQDAGASILLPAVADERGDTSMVFRPWLAGDELIVDRFGIAAPVHRDAVEPEIVLVPLVAFDNSGNRLGRGAGFYDRYLAARSVRSVGVAFEGQRVDVLATQPHDQPLDAVVTELGVRWFGKPLRSEPIDTRTAG